MFWLIPLTFFITFNILSDILSKEYSLTTHWHFAILALIGYTIGNIFWLWQLRSGSGLARGAVLFCVFNAIFTLIIGLYFYGEPTNKIQITGMILGVLSLILILWQ